MLKHENTVRSRPTKAQVTKLAWSETDKAKDRGGGGRGGHPLTHAQNDVATTTVHYIQTKSCPEP